jgi:hypothetical protein
MKKILVISVCCASLLVHASQIDGSNVQLKQQNKLIEALTKRLDKLENNLQEEKHSAYMQNSKVKGISSSFSQKEYLPDIALIINSSAVGRNIDNVDYPKYSIDGFTEPNPEMPFNKERGFNFNYAEVAMSSAVDPNFDAFSIFHMSSEEFEVDEAYVTTRDLSNGLKIKAGKFKSAFGRYNEKHQHAWDFSEQTLVYNAFFGAEGIGDSGIQLQWVAPIDTYVMLGVEAMQGTNELSFGYEKSNNLYNTYAKTSVDITDDTSVLAGISMLHGKNLKGDTNIYATDFTLQTQLSSYSSLALQSEYIYRDKEQNENTLKQDGMYAQLVYKYNQNYATGIRYDVLMKNNNKTDNLDMYTGMIEYKPFEFSRLRLEYSLDKSKYFDGEQQDVQQLMLELNVAVGAHGAHSF